MLKSFTHISNISNDMFSDQLIRYDKSCVFNPLNEMM